MTGINDIVPACSLYLKDIPPKVSLTDTLFADLFFYILK